MSEPIEGLYFNWLCAKVLYDESPLAVGVLRILYETEFVWRLPGDGNRAAQGKRLRSYFFTEMNIEPDPAWDLQECSVFEMMLAFAKDAEFECDGTAQGWFWLMMDNLGLGQYRVSPVGLDDALAIEEILYRLVWRTYDRWGNGGLWPLQNTDQDQSEVEIWYQFAAYLIDQGLL